MSRRPGPLLRSSPAVAVWLIPSLTLLTLAGALLAILGAAAIRQGSHTEARLKGAATVVVWGRGLESSDAAQARAAEILAGVAGVQRATALDLAPDDQLVAQAMGAPAGTEARLVAVTSASTHLAAQLTQVLRARGVSAVASDRAAAGSPGHRALLLALVGDVGLPLLVILAMIAMSVQAGRREALLARPALDLLRQFGAADRFLNRLLRRRSAVRAVACAVVGVAGAVIAALAWKAGGALGVPLGPIDLVWAAPWVVIAGLIGAFATPRMAR